VLAGTLGTVLPKLTFEATAKGNLGRKTGDGVLAGALGIPSAVETAAPSHPSSRRQAANLQLELETRTQPPLARVKMVGATGLARLRSVLQTRPAGGPSTLRSVKPASQVRLPSPAGKLPAGAG
jgi:hypothetical protein